MNNSTYTHTTWTIVPAIKFADMQEFDCHFCAYHTLTKPVFLKSAEGVIVAAGAACAALTMYGTKTQTARVRKEFDAIQFLADQAEEVTIERRARYARALAAFERDDDGHEDLRSARTTFHLQQPNMTFQQFMMHVARTGHFA